MKHKFSLKTVITLMLLASALTYIALAAFIGYPFGFNDNRSDAVRDFAALLSVIDMSYIGDYDENEVTAAAMRAAVDALDDPWSFFMTYEEFRQNQNNTQNRYEGIGVTVVSDEETEGLKIVQIVYGSAADTAGLVPGDVILAVDGTSTKGITHHELRDLLRRPIGDSIVLSLLRHDGYDEDVTVVFGFVFVDPVHFGMLDNDIGYIRLYNFHSGSAQSFIAATHELIAQGAQGLVFDMRGNPGGWVTQMTEILDFLLPEGEIFVFVDRAGNEQITRSDAYYIDLPMVVLVNRFSFSGAEYFAAMLREFDFAQIVGEQTTGKSRIQRAIELPRGGAVNISFAEYLTKNRVSLHDEGGVVPDYIVALSDEAFAQLVMGTLEHYDDLQLQKAIELLMQHKFSLTKN